MYEIPELRSGVYISIVRVGTVADYTILLLNYFDTLVKIEEESVQLIIYFQGENRFLARILGVTVRFFSKFFLMILNLFQRLHLFNHRVEFLEIVYIVIIANIMNRIYQCNMRVHT